MAGTLVVLVVDVDGVKAGPNHERGTLVGDVRPAEGHAGPAAGVVLTLLPPPLIADVLPLFLPPNAAVCIFSTLSVVVPSVRTTPASTPIPRRLQTKTRFGPRSIARHARVRTLPLLGPLALAQAVAGLMGARERRTRRGRRARKTRRISRDITALMTSRGTASGRLALMIS